MTPVATNPHTDEKKKVQNEKKETSMKFAVGRKLNFNECEPEAPQNLISQKDEDNKKQEFTVESLLAGVVVPPSFQPVADSPLNQIPKDTTTK